MSIEKEIESVINGMKSDYTCEKCGHTQEVNLFPLIDFSQNPEYYALVKDLSIYKVKCEQCGDEEFIQFDSLIVDIQHGYILYVLSDKNNLERFRHQITYFVETTLNKDEKFNLDEIKTRVVFSHNELLEKMSIFEVGLDDEVIETMKAGFKKMEGFDFSKYDEIRFDRMEGTDLFFVAFSTKSQEVNPKAIKIDIGGYNRVVEDLAPIKNRNREYFEEIDEDWVRKITKEA